MKPFIALSCIVFVFGVLCGVTLFHGINYLSHPSNFASGGVESRNARHSGSETGLITRQISESGSSAPPAGNSSDPEWHPNPDKPLRPQLALYAANVPRLAADLALRIPWAGDEDEDPPINDPIGTVMRVWGKSDPPAATAFYESMTDSERKVGAAFGLVHGLAEDDVEHAAKLAKHAGKHAYKLAEHDASLAATWVEKNLQHPDAVAFIAIVVPHMEPKRAERWLAGLPLDEHALEMTRGLVAARPRRFEADSKSPLKP